MRLSRFAFFILIAALAMAGGGCSLYKRAVVQKKVVDGAKAFKERKFAEAEELFRAGVAADPKFETKESKLAELFLARTMHAQFESNRKDTAKADEAIKLYRSVLEKNPADKGSFRSLVNLLNGLNRDEEWLKEVTARSENAGVPPEQRAEAYDSLAARKLTCAKDISEADENKKTITENGKQVFKYSKPADGAKFDKLKQCTSEGMALVDKALELEKQAGVENDATWSYKANLIYQKMRIAEMEGDTAEKDRLKKEGDTAAEKYRGLMEKRKQEEEAKAKAEAANEANKGK